MVRRYKPPRKPRKQRRPWKQLSVDYTPNSQRWMDDHSEQYTSSEPYETEWRLYTRAERVGDRKAKKLHGDRFQELLKQLHEARHFEASGRNEATDCVINSAIDRVINKLVKEELQ